jgi:serine/threonine protein kinase
VGRQRSRPVDLLKLASLWLDMRSRTDWTGEFVVDGLLSLGAAKTLGRGLSFEVIQLRVGEGLMAALQLRSKFVVYKRLRGLTDQLDSIERGELLQAALLEVRVLTHDPLRNHPNIIKLIDLIWEPDPDVIDRAWPTLVLEYAENGTLADFQEDYPNLSFLQKAKICIDIGNGLLALHASEIVHGDLKSENVLICESPDNNGVIAKLADFGCAIADLDPSDTLRLPAFTLPWNAPECHESLPRKMLRYTDVYSYGLLVWRVVLDGMNPFRSIEALSGLSKADLQQQVDILKSTDQLLPHAQATLRYPFCEPDVDTQSISRVLGMTLRLDAYSRDLVGSLTLLGRHPPVADPIEPLTPYEYEGVLYHPPPLPLTILFHGCVG